MEIEKKYYATNLKALSLGECIRLGGGVPMGFLSWIMGRFLPPQGNVLMPINFTEIEASEDDLSEQLRERIRELAKDFLNRKFKIVAYQKLPLETGNAVDSGGCVLLSSCGEIVGTINIVINEDSSGLKYTEALSVACFDENGNGIGTQNTPTLDPKKGSRTITKKDADLGNLLEELNKACKKWRENFIQFSGWERLRDTMQKVEDETFLYRRDVKKLFVEVQSNELSPAERDNKIEEFWHWFETNQDMLLSMKVGDDSINKIIEQVGKKLEEVGPLAHEFCLEDKDGKRDFIVSADGVEENVLLVEEMVKAAPQLERWNIIKFKPRKGFDEIGIGPIKFSKDNVKYSFKKTEKLDVTLYFEDCKEKLGNLYTQVLFIILDGVLGEYAVMTRIGEIEWKSMDDAPSNAKSVADMAEEFDELQKDCYWDRTPHR